MYSSINNGGTAKTFFSLNWWLQEVSDIAKIHRTNLFILKIVECTCIKKLYVAKARKI
jgi:hypothetical protein